MKYIFATFILLISSFSLNAQNLEVDKRNGFKEIKLGVHYSSFEGFKEIPSNNPNTIIGTWSTSDSNLGYLFDNKIDYFVLEFDRETKLLKRLEANILIKKPFSDPSVLNKLIEIDDKLSDVLGQPSSVTKDPEGLIWTGNKVCMASYINYKRSDTKFNDDGNLTGTTTLTFCVFSIENIKKENKKGF